MRVDVHKRSEGDEKRRGFGRAIAAGMGLGLMLPAAALAAEDSYPKFSGAVGFEIEDDYAFDSDAAANEQNELGGVIEPDLYLHFSENFYVNTVLTLEAVNPPGAGQDRVFQEHGIYVGTLTVNYETDNFGVYAGKFGPNFSLGYDAAAGLYGTDILGDDVELAEFLGFGGSVGLGETGMGDLTVSASLFMADRTILSESFITNRGRNNLAAGGPGNTEAPESFALALDGELDDIAYQVSVARLGFDVGDDEYRAAVAGMWSLDAGNGVTVTPFLEYIRFWNAGGANNEERNYFTASLATEFDAWNVALAFTGKDVDVSGANGSTFDHQTSVSFGYAFENGFTVDVGYKYNVTGRVDTQTVGALVTYGIEF